MLLSLLLLQGLVAALLFYVLAGQYQRQPLWNMLAVLISGFVPPLNWCLLLVAVGVRMWRRSPSMVAAKH
ncbi:MAG: hypothetical protein WEA82_10020 [Idiomarina sp.]